MIRTDQFLDIEKQLQSLASPGIKPGLARLSKLLSLAGNPERTFCAVHIVGTNGKGSTAATLESIIRESGYSTALYTSPHLVSFGERLEINGIQLSPDKWSLPVAKIKKIILTCEFFKENPPTFFELITAAAFMVIAEEHIEIAIIEAGLGGRLDATNIIKNVLLTVITPIGTDHTEFLGKDLESIANEKFAVMRKGICAIFSGGPDNLEEAFFAMAARHSTPAKLLKDLAFCGLIKTALTGTDFYVERDSLRMNYHTPLIGTFQAENAALAVNAAYLLKNVKNGYFNNINVDTLYKGVFNTKWDGRFELIRKSPVLILDGAHNPHAFKRLVETLLLIMPKGSLNIVLAMMKDKDIRLSLELLKTLDPIIYCTQVPDVQRSLTSKELFIQIKKYGIRSTGEWSDPIAAIKSAVDSGFDTICCGSLYLVGFIKAHNDEF